MDKNKRITFVLGKSVIRKVQGMEIEKKVESMLNQMNLDEKIAQTRTIPTNDFILDDEEKRLMFSKGELQSERIKKALQFGLGAFQLPGKNLSIEESVQYRNILQKYLKEHTRLGIPALVHEECLNGQLAKNSTMFPKPIAMASSFNVELVEQVYDVIGKETRARGGHQAFTPVLDLGRDPRWGRIEETYGEDTCLVSEIGLAAVKGLQGGKDGVEKGHIVASPKHFAGYGQCEGGRNFAPTNLTERYLRDHVFPPFETAKYGTDVVAAMGIAQKINMIPVYILLGMSQGIMPLIGYTYSNGNFNRLKKTYCFSVLFSIFFSAVMVIVYILNAKTLISVFTTKTSIISYGQYFLRGLCFSLPFLSIDFLTLGVYQSCGKGHMSLFLAILRKMILEIPVIYLLDFYFPIYGVSYAQMIAEIVLATICVTSIMKFFKHL